MPGRRPLPRKLRLKNKLLSLDSTVIALCLRTFDWALFRRTKGAITLHRLLDHDGYLPCFAVITEGKVAEVRVAQGAPVEPRHHRRGGSRVDRLPPLGPLDGRWRLVGHPSEGQRARRCAGGPSGAAVPARLEGSDALPGRRRSGSEVPDPAATHRGLEPGEAGVLVFLTNHCRLGAPTIASIYKHHWQIELFFKAR